MRGSVSLGLLSSHRMGWLLKGDYSVFNPSDKVSISGAPGGVDRSASIRYQRGALYPAGALSLARSDPIP